MTHFWRALKAYHKLVCVCLFVADEDLSLGWSWEKWWTYGGISGELAEMITIVIKLPIVRFTLEIVNAVYSIALVK